MNKLLQLVKSFDRHGHTIGVNYRGENQFKTLFGAFLTIFNFMFIIDLSLGRFLSMFMRHSQTIES